MIATKMVCWIFLGGGGGSCRRSPWLCA